MWNNGLPQLAMGYWLKSFDTKPYPVPGTTFTIPEINNRKSQTIHPRHCDQERLTLPQIIVPLVATGIFVVVAFTWAWISDGPFRGARWPFIYIGAILTVSVKAHCAAISHY